MSSVNVLFTKVAKASLPAAGSIVPGKFYVCTDSKEIYLGTDSDTLVLLTDTNDISQYGTCSTAAATAAKTSSIFGFELKTGATVKVKFTNTNTVANPTLNVNSTGAKPIMRYGTTAASTSTAASWNAGAVVSLVYDGTNWIMCDWTNQDGSSDTKVTQTVRSDSKNYPLLLAPTGQTATATTTANFGTKFQANPSTGNLQATQFNGYVLAAASAKGVDTSITASTTSTNLPTSAAVESRINAHSGIDKTGTVTSVATGDGLTGGPITTTGTISLATSGVTAGTYNEVTVDAYGRVTGATNVDLLQNLVDGTSGSVRGLSTTEESTTYSMGNQAFAIGYGTKASGDQSTAEGYDTTASGNQAHAEGYGTTASGVQSHAEGSATTASGDYSHAEGYDTEASNYQAHAEGYGTTASGANSHAEGNGTTASGDQTHAEGSSTTASGPQSHAEGVSTTASGPQSHAEGVSTTASGPQSHTEGYGTTASGYCSHAEGTSTTASGNYSHAEGTYTIANHANQHVFGEFNVADVSENAASLRGVYIEIVGNGTANDARSNARTLDWDGNEVIAGGMTAANFNGFNLAAACAKGVDTSIAASSTSTNLPTSAAVEARINAHAGIDKTGTVTSVTLKATSPIAIDSTAAITTSGTRTLSHANSGVTAGTYRSVTVNATGHVTAGTNPTTLAGYGITDAKIASGVITLGSNTITPLTSGSTLNAAKLSGAIPTSVTQTEWDAAYTHSTSTHARTDATAVAASETNGNIIIDGTETTVYTHPTTAGNKHIPSGGSSGQFLGYDSAGTAKWVSNPNSDTKVTQTLKSDSKNYPLLLAPTGQTATATTTSCFGTKFQANPSTGNLQATQFNGYVLAAASAKGVDTSISSGSTSTNLPTSKAVEDRIVEAIDALPSPMVFKGSLGTGGTITSLPDASADNTGYTYKVITAGTYASQAAKVGDMFISDGSAWVYIPSADEPSGTVTSVTIKATSPISIDSTNAITTSGTRTLSHANSGVTAGTYRSVTVNATGHVTAGTNPTTLSGYGITDAKIASGVITLGSNTITPLTSSSTLNAAKLSGAIPASVTQTEWDAAYTHSTSTHARTDATAVSASETNGNIKINGTETTVYTHPTTAGNKHIPSGGSSGKFLGWDSAGTAKWVSNPNSDTKVKQTATTTNANYEVLFSVTADNTTRTEEARKNSNLKFNPSTGNLQATQLNGVTIGSSPKFTDTTYTVGTTTVPNVTNVGSTPTLGTAIPADDITAWTANTPTSATVTSACLKITTGSAASLSYTAKSIPNVTNVGSTPTLGTAITVVNSVTEN